MGNVTRAAPSQVSGSARSDSVKAGVMGVPVTNCPPNATAKQPVNAAKEMPNRKKRLCGSLWLCSDCDGSVASSGIELFQSAECYRKNPHSQTGNARRACGYNRSRRWLTGSHRFSFNPRRYHGKPAWQVNFWRSRADRITAHLRVKCSDIRPGRMDTPKK